MKNLFDDAGTAGVLARLARDVHHIQNGGYPSDVILAQAPTLENWRYNMRPVSVMTGSIWNHPVLGSRLNGVTSEVYAVCPRKTWVRTLSRYYVLGRPYPDGER